MFLSRTASIRRLSDDILLDTFNSKNIRKSLLDKHFIGLYAARRKYNKVDGHYVVCSADVP